MLSFAPDYDHLPLIAKVEVFEYALQNTEGNDLSRVSNTKKLVAAFSSSSSLSLLPPSVLSSVSLSLTCNRYISK